MVINDSSPDIIDKIGYARFFQLLSDAKGIIQKVPAPVAAAVTAWAIFSLLLLLMLTKRTRSSN